MTFLPVVERELRVASRRPHTYWGRASGAFLAIALGGYVYAVSRVISWWQVGDALFTALVWLAFLSCLLAGVRHTAGCISSERRDDTLGLLFLTDLRGYDIALGKLVASSISALQGLLALLPVLAIPLLLGGVTGAQLARVTAVLLATLLYSLSLGMFVSVWFKHDRPASVLVLVALVCVTLGPWVVAALWASTHRANPPEYLLLPSPAYAQWLAASGGFPGGGRGHFGVVLGLLVAQGLGLLGLTSWLLPRWSHERVASARRERRRAWWQALREGTAASRAEFRAKLLALNPFYWLAARTRRAPVSVWTFLGLSVLAWFGVGALWPEFDEPRFLLLSMFLHGTLRCWIAFAATKRLAEDRRTGALELLLTTPLSVREVVGGQFRAIGRQFKGPIVAALLLDVVLCWLMTREFAADQEITLLVFAARGLILVADACALAWYGMWRALTTRSAGQAAAVSLFGVLVLPWIGFIALVSLYTLSHLDHWNWEFTDRVALGTWFVLGLATDVILGLVAYARLSTRFRLAASEWRPPAGWRRFLGM